MQFEAGESRESRTIKSCDQAIPETQQIHKPSTLDAKVEKELLLCLREINEDQEVIKIRANIQTLRVFKDSLVQS